MLLLTQIIITVKFTLHPSCCCWYVRTCVRTLVYTCISYFKVSSAGESRTYMPHSQGDRCISPLADGWVSSLAGVFLPPLIDLSARAGGAFRYYHSVACVRVAQPHFRTFRHSLTHSHNVRSPSLPYGHHSGVPDSAVGALDAGEVGVQLQHRRWQHALVRRAPLARRQPQVATKTARKVVHHNNARMRQRARTHPQKERKHHKVLPERRRRRRR